MTRRCRALSACNCWRSRSSPLANTENGSSMGCSIGSSMVAPGTGAARTECRSAGYPSHEHEPDAAYLAPKRLLNHPLRDGDVTFLRELLIPAVGAAAILGLGHLGLA